MKKNLSYLFLFSLLLFGCASVEKNAGNDSIPASPQRTICSEGFQGIAQ